MGKKGYQDAVILFSYGPARKTSYASVIFHNCRDVVIDKGHFKGKCPYGGAKLRTASVLNGLAFLTFQNGLASLTLRYKKFAFVPLP
jgi:hypothetical protein